MTAITGTIAVFLALILSRPFTTLVHEIGHALPSLAFTNKKVTIYVGSYGNLEKSFKFNIGRLEIFFTPKLFSLGQGLCSHASPRTLGQSIIIVLGGPVFSLLLGLFFSWLILSYKNQPEIAFVMGIFLTSGIFDFITNIIPNTEPLVMHDGRTTHNDGFQFQRMLQTSKYPTTYFEAMKALNNNQYELAKNKLLETAESGIDKGPLYEETMQLFTHGNFIKNGISEAILFHEAYGSNFKLESSDFLRAGNLYRKAGNDLKAINNYGKAIEVNYKNAAALYQRATLFHKLGYNEKAKADLKKVILIDEGHRGARELMKDSAFN